MIFDSWFDSYRGVIILVKIIDGVMKKGDKIKFLSNNAEYEINEVGVNTPKPTPLESAGGRGSRLHHRQHQEDLRGQDRRHRHPAPAETGVPPLPGFKEPLPMVFAGFYPAEGTSHEELREAIEKLTLNDSSLTYRARVLAGPGHRLPLRFPGPAAQGDHPGAPGAGILPLHRHHRPLGALPHHLQQGRDLRDRIPGRSCPTRSTTRRSRSRSSRPSSSPPTSSWATS